MPPIRLHLPAFHLHNGRDGFQDQRLLDGSVSLTTPDLGGYVNGGGTGGWSYSVTGNSWPLASPRETHLTGLTPANFLFLSSPQYDQNFTRIVGSGYIGAAPPRLPLYRYCRVPPGDDTLRRYHPKNLAKSASVGMLATADTIPYTWTSCRSATLCRYRASSRLRLSKGYNPPPGAMGTQAPG